MTSSLDKGKGKEEEEEVPEWEIALHKQKSRGGADEATSPV